MTHTLCLFCVFFCLLLLFCFFWSYSASRSRAGHKTVMFFFLCEKLHSNATKDLVKYICKLRWLDDGNRTLLSLCIDTLVSMFGFRKPPAFMDFSNLTYAFAHFFSTFHKIVMNHCTTYVQICWWAGVKSCEYCFISVSFMLRIFWFNAFRIAFLLLLSFSISNKLYAWCLHNEFFIFLH